MPGHLLTRPDDIARLVRSLRRVAVLGIKTETQAGQPAIEVPRYLRSQGIEVVPVPVYFPGVERILGAPVFRRVRDIPGAVDCVDVFRRSKDLGPHLDDLLDSRPRSVWLQLGIRDDAFARALVDAGIDVVQDRCLLVEHRRAALREGGPPAP
jgi:predicted CoA-binding protein